jgi:hypothetical protein
METETQTTPLVTNLSNNQFTDRFLYYMPELSADDLAILDAAEDRRCESAKHPQPPTADTTLITYIDWQNIQEAQLYIDPKKMAANLRGINKIRAISYSWLHELACKYNCTKSHNRPCYTPNTYFRATQIADMYLSLRPITKKLYQALCITAMYMASKFEDIVILDIDDAAWITAGAASRSDILQCERDILCTLPNIAYPTLYTYYLIHIEQLDTVVDRDYLLGLLYIVAYIPQFCGMTPSATVLQCIRYVQNTAPINRIHISPLPHMAVNAKCALIRAYYDIIVNS